MNLKTITAEIDKKIANLNQLKVTVAELWEMFADDKHVRNAVNGVTRTRKAGRPRTKRVLSVTARAAISAAQKARWKAWKKAKAA